MASVGRGKVETGGGNIYASDAKVSIVEGEEAGRASVRAPCLPSARQARASFPRLWDLVSWGIRAARYVPMEDKGLG